MSALSDVRRHLLDGWDLLAPVLCAGCDAPGRQLCSLCAHLLRGHPPRVEDIVWGGPGREIPVAFCAPYAGVLARVVRRYKDNDRTPLARHLAPLLRASFLTISAATPGELIAVPVPSTPQSTRLRGFVPLELLTRKAGLPMLPALHSRNRADLAGLGRAERFRDVAHTMSCSRPLRGREVVIVDDVLTSGATAQEAVRALTAAGARVRGVAVCARTLYRSSE